ncbi:MAG: hypothetical protein J3K34DRAFT_146459 [Monoraphidium minutum]|nr:MAG: hypothetical protein J3K34DRAFT_146459 [Monoraphidium minutum]
MGTRSRDVCVEMILQGARLRPLTLDSELVAEVDSVAAVELELRGWLRQANVSPDSVQVIDPRFAAPEGEDEGTGGQERAAISLTALSRRVGHVMRGDRPTRTPGTAVAAGAAAAAAAAATSAALPLTATSRTTVRTTARRRWTRRVTRLPTPS